MRFGDGVGGKTTILLPLSIFLNLHYIFLIVSQKFPIQSQEQYSVSVMLEKNEFETMLKQYTEHCATSCGDFLQQNLEAFL